MGYNDEQILNMLVKDDKKGFDRLFQRYYKPLVVFANKYMLDFPLAEDLVQEVFVKFWNEKCYLTLRSQRISTFLFSMVRNRCINELKKNNIILDSLDVNTLTIAEKEIVALSETEIEEVYKSLELLPLQTRKVVECVMLQNMKYKEAADELNVSVNTVKTLLRRGVAQLRRSVMEADEIKIAMLILIEIHTL